METTQINTPQPAVVSPGVEGKVAGIDRMISSAHVDVRQESVEQQNESAQQSISAAPSGAGVEQDGGAPSSGSAQGSVLSTSNDQTIGGKSPWMEAHERGERENHARWTVEDQERQAASAARERQAAEEKSSCGSAHGEEEEEREA